MRAVVCSGQGTTRVDQKYAMPTPAPGEALLRIVLAGICSTDVEVAFRGYKDGFSGVLGHECVAVVEALNIAVGEECTVGRGDRVVPEINVVPNGSKCTDYHTRAQDPQRTALGLFGHDGVFADYVCVPIENLNKVPDNVPNEDAVFAEPLASACQIMQQVDVKPTHKVAVLGIGKLGILTCLVLRGSGNSIVGISRGGRHFDVLQARGIRTKKLSEALEDSKSSFDIVVDCTGNVEGFNSALELVKPYGRIVLKTTVAGKTPADLTKVVVKEVTLVGSRCGPIDAALRLLSEGLVNVRGLITDFFTLTDFPRAMSRALQPDSIKIVLSMD